MILSTIAQQLGSSLGRAAVKPTPQPAAPAQTPAPAMSSPVAPTTTLATPAKQTVSPVVVSANPAAEKTIKMVQNTNALSNAVNQQAQQNAMSGYASTDPTIQAKIAEMQRQAMAQSSQVPVQPAASSSPVSPGPATVPSATTSQPNGPSYWDPVLNRYVQGDINVDKPWTRFGLSTAAAMYNTDVNTLRALEAGNNLRGIDVGAKGSTGSTSKYWDPGLRQYINGDIETDKPWLKYGLNSREQFYSTDPEFLVQQVRDGKVKPPDETQGANAGAGGGFGAGSGTGGGAGTGASGGAAGTNALPYQGEIDRLQRETDDLQKKYMEDFEKMRQGQIPLTEGQQLQLDTIKRQFDDVIQQQKVYNENYTQMTNRAGIVSGRNRYAPEVALGQIKKTVDDGVSRIAGLNLQALDTMFQVKQAMQQENWKQLDASYAKLDQFMQRRQKTFQDMQDKLLEQAEKVKAYNRQAEQDKINYSKEVAPGLADGLTYLKSDGSIYQPTEDEILATARTSGIDANILRSNVQKQISKIREDQKKKADKELESLNKDKRDLLDSAAKNSAPQSVINAINKATTYAEAIQAGGDYLADASGDVGKYNFYAREERKAGRVPMSPNAFFDVEANRKAKLQTASGLSPQVSSQVDALARSFDSHPIVKDYNVIQDKKLTIDQIVNSGNTGPGDVALVYQFMKALDPNSVVRDTEFETARKSGNIFEGAFAKFNGYFKDKGGSLPQSVRDEFKRLIDISLQSKERQYNNLRQETARKINKKTGATDGDEYLTDYSGALTTKSISNAQKSLDDFYVANPDKQGQIDALSVDPRNFSDEQILQIIQDGFSPVGSDTKPAVPVSFDQRVNKLAAAIAQHETGNQNKAGATGELPTRYQFMPATWKRLAQKHLGDANAPTTDENQDLVAKAEIADLFKKGYNEREIAMIWNGGVPRRKVGTTKTTTGKTINYDTGKYADNVLKLYNS